MALILRYQLIGFVKQSTSPSDVNTQCFAVLNKIVELENLLKTHRYARKIAPIKPLIFQLGFEDSAYLMQVLDNESLFKAVIFLKKQLMSLTKIKEFNLKVIPILEKINDFSEATLNAIYYLIDKNPDVFLKFSPSFEKNPNLIKTLYQIAIAMTHDGKIDESLLKDEENKIKVYLPILIYHSMLFLNK